MRDNNAEFATLSQFESCEQSAGFVAFSFRADWFDAKT
jgi:hypothetical protein